MKFEGELINMTRAWDKEKFWVPDRSRTHDLPNTGRALNLTSFSSSKTFYPFLLLLFVDHGLHSLCWRVVVEGDLQWYSKLSLKKNCRETYGSYIVKGLSDFKREQWTLCREVRKIGVGETSSQPGWGIWLVTRGRGDQTSNDRNIFP